MRIRALVVVLALAAPAAAAAQDLGPRTVVPMHVACADVVVTDLPPSATLAVAGAQRGDGRLSLALGDAAVINAGTAQGLAVGQAFFARRHERQRMGPRSGPVPYVGVRTTGLLVIEAVDERYAVARVRQSCDSVVVGDYLEPAVVPALPAVAAAGAPDFSDRATVLFGEDLREAFGDGDVLSIDRGSNHGVAPGTRFALYKDPQTGLPLSELGEAVVVDVTSTTARAVLVKARDVVEAGDVAVRRAALQP